MSKTSSSRCGFTLVELLVVIGIIALLISILLPSLARARRQAQLVLDLSNIRQVTLALMTYSTENKGKMLPAEDPDQTKLPGTLRTLNKVFDNSWTTLTTQYKLPRAAYGCNTLSNLPQNVCDLFGLYQQGWNGSGCSIIGWNYFGGRTPNPLGPPSTAYRLYLDPATKTYQPFNVLHSFSDKQATSQVLLTCINYDAYDGGQTYENICTHYKGTALYEPPNTPWKKNMDGLCCSFTDGHAVYVPYAQLVYFRNNTSGSYSSITFMPSPYFKN